MRSSMNRCIENLFFFFLVCQGFQHVYTFEKEKERRLISSSSFFFFFAEQTQKF